MEGINLRLEALTSPWSIIGGVSLLAVVVRLVAVGCMADEEKAGRRLSWVDWPIPGTEEIVKAGESWTEAPGNIHAAVNAGTATARVVAVFLLPKGAEVQTMVK